MRARHHYRHTNTSIGDLLYLPPQLTLPSSYVPVMTSAPPPLLSPPSPPGRAISGCTVYFETAVRDAITDWANLLDARRTSYLATQAIIDEGNEKLEKAALDSHLARRHPDTDDGRADILRELRGRYFVSFSDWVPEEVEIFARMAYPFNLMRTTTTDGKSSAFLHVIRDSWQPSTHHWLLFLWRFCQGARELFSDYLFLVQNQDRLPLSELGTVLFDTMIRDRVYTHETCASIVGALVPFPKECHYARIHAREIRQLAQHLGPSTVGLLVRSLVIHRSHNPVDMSCGYLPGESICVCTDVVPNTRLPRGLMFDIEKEYICILLSLLIGRPGEEEGLFTEKIWTSQQCDEMIAAACDHIFVKATYVAIYASLRFGEKPKRPQSFPRPTVSQSEMDIYRHTEDDFENGLFQTGACVKRDCKQVMKARCPNVACGAHCQQGFFNCKAHRFYNPRTPGYCQRRGIKVKEEVPIEKRDESLTTRDPDLI